ncbi:adenylylsulfate kinase /sulfate adenylyltransferase subunit 1 [Jatrophihabitans endophyticus]|uniref:Multifunctional fusion protein n=1 Tax=Jatrophihabitans endophyticus TaxID=1206085 RepID=A0A1M5KQ47_9ACTN|nr:sulfate adenylyltransferase subunit CysN [Jatrophihabitans endophyticus]SHG54855.1 adenylylsulfate kinase /sulfate adenylyltransferase subunit 1 [Jatrophihabitans endophyticus]
MSELLRLATAGSVDDGKSTLIGRLLFDSKAIFEDQLSAVAKTSESRGQAAPDLALLTDGLRAEREQGITIDVAYRYFATPRRKFIIADTPGHIQYTRNMVTGASTADVAMILIDARNGVLEQSRRHAFLASLLGIPHLIVCINKMDLVDFSQERFEEIRSEFRRFATKLEISDLAFIPMSALSGDNVVQRSDAMPWYEGTSLLHHLEQVHIDSDRNLIDVRLPVQYVIRPQQTAGTELHDFRGYAGTIAGGVIRTGDEVTVLPSGFTTSVSAVWAPGGRKLDEASAGQAVTLELADDIDISRGDLICRPHNRPHVGQELDAMVSWMTAETELKAGGRYVVQHTTRSTRGVVRELDYRLDVNTLHRDETAQSLQLNEIGRIRFRTQQPLLFDAYRRSRETGSFILVDEATNNTVAAGMITGPAQRESHVVWHSGSVQRGERATKGITVWLTGLSGSGKSTVAAEVERRLVASGRPAYLLDGDNLRHGLNADLGFSAADRAENVRRTGEVARLLADAGLVTVVSLVSPYAADRERVRAAHAEGGLPFVEVFVDTPLSVCEQRDPKGMYAKARAGEISHFTGVDDPYEAPESPHLRLRPEDGDAAAQAALVLDLIERISD